MPVKIIHHLLNVVGGSQEREAKKKKRGRRRGDAGLQAGIRVRERQSVYAYQTQAGVGRTEALTSRAGDRTQLCNLLYSPKFQAWRVQYPSTDRFTILSPFMSIPVWSLWFYHLNIYSPPKIDHVFMFSPHFAICGIRDRPHFTCDFGEAHEQFTMSGAIRWQHEPCCRNTFTCTEAITPCTHITQVCLPF